MNIDVNKPFSIKAWMDKHESQCVPPICAKEIWSNRGLQVFMVGGPNVRTDFHRNPYEEMFYQVKGDMILTVIENGKKRDIEIKEGELYLCPPMLPHSPQRKAGTLGFVQEVRRSKDELDEMFWLCDKCDNLLYSDKFYNEDNGTTLPQVVKRYVSNPDHMTCKKCGWVDDRYEGKL